MVENKILTIKDKHLVAILNSAFEAGINACSVEMGELHGMSYPKKYVDREKFTTFMEQKDIKKFLEGNS